MDFHYRHFKKQFTTGREVGWGTYTNTSSLMRGSSLGRLKELEIWSLLLGDPEVWDQIYYRES